MRLVVYAAISNILEAPYRVYRGGFFDKTRDGVSDIDMLRSHLMEKDDGPYQLTAKEVDCCISFLEREGLLKRFVGTARDGVYPYAEYEYEGIKIVHCTGPCLDRVIDRFVKGNNMRLRVDIGLSRIINMRGWTTKWEERQRGDTEPDVDKIRSYLMKKDDYGPHLTAEEADCCISFLEHEGLLTRHLRKARRMSLGPGGEYPEYEYEAVDITCDTEFTRATRVIERFEEWYRERDFSSSSTTRASEALPLPAPFPDSLKCPLSLSVMQDPVVAEDGHTYERSCIERWFSTGNHTSPLTRERIGTKLTPSLTIKKLVEELGGASGV